jgi:hypothetical protein
MNFKLKFYVYKDDLEVTLLAEFDDSEQLFIGIIKDYAIAAEICRRWNEHEIRN